MQTKLSVEHTSTSVVLAVRKVYTNMWQYNFCSLGRKVTQYITAFMQFFIIINMAFQTTECKTGIPKNWFTKMK